MERRGARQGRPTGLVALAWALLAIVPSAARAQAVTPSPQDRSGATPPLSIRQLLRMSGPQLDALYEGASPGPIPCGKVRGRAIVKPGSTLNPALSAGARVAWQGKVFDPTTSTATNRFFGVRIIRGVVSYGPSWRDGRLALILDYRDTSRIYARYRDEIRQVAPGLYLGLMYDRTTAPPAFKTYFLLEAPQ